MARMVATKAALSIRVDALTDADGKSEPMAPSIGIENRAKLEARLKALEEGVDAAGVRAARNGKTQQRFAMTGETSTYNTAADTVDLVPTQREPLEAAVKATLDVKAEKRKAKEERRAKKKVEKELKDSDAESDDNENKMDVDGEEEEEEKKRKRRESKVDGEKKKRKHDDETEEERKARKKAKKAEKAAAAAGAGATSDSSKKKRKKSEE